MTLGVRPEHVLLGDAKGEGGTGFDAAVEVTEQLGAELLVGVRTAGTIVIASRIRLNLPTTELVGRGRLRRITTESLRFTLPETIALLQSRFGARLDRDACARLHELSEG